MIHASAKAASDVWEDESEAADPHRDHHTSLGGRSPQKKNAVDARSAARRGSKKAKYTKKEGASRGNFRDYPPASVSGRHGRLSGKSTVNVACMCEPGCDRGWEASGKGKRVGGENSTV